MNTMLSYSQSHLVNRDRLMQWASEGKLYAMMDPFFEVALPVERARLETRDTDPIFYEIIAWDQVSYQPSYLVRATPEVVGWILNSLSTERWGIFVVSHLDLQVLAKHYQKFVIARGPDGNPYFLRFHDASVLEVLLKTWGPKEKAVFFSPTVAFGLPDLDTMDVRIESNPFGAARLVSDLPNPEDCLLELRDAQLRQCGEAIDRDLIKVIAWHLRNHHPKSVQFLPKEVLEERVELAIAKGRGYSLGTVADLAGFAALMFELAPNFDEHPSFRNVLLDPSVPGEAKMRRLSQVISDEEWREAVAMYDRGFWTTARKKKRK